MALRLNGPSYVTLSFPLLSYKPSNLNCINDSTLTNPLYLYSIVDKSFARASEFIPERWYSRPEMVDDKRAFTSFSIGRFACVGKNLALAELRFVTA